MEEKQIRHGCGGKKVLKSGKQEGSVRQRGEMETETLGVDLFVCLELFM